MVDIICIKHVPNLQLLKDGEGKLVTVARSPENRIKNRLSNISACNYPLTTDYMQYHTITTCLLCVQMMTIVWS